MSFVTQEDVFKVGEEVLHDTFVKFAPEGSRITETPFPIISYKQAMLEFGCDKAGSAQSFENYGCDGVFPEMYV